MEHLYVAIDLKSFYASVECVERHLDPLSTNLVVADPTRTEKTICLAVSPSLKAYGIPGRPRLFEVIQKVRDINRDRHRYAVRNKYIRKNEDGEYCFSSSSFDSEALNCDPSLELSYITAPPRMKLYEIYSTKVNSIYLKYIAPEDIHVYSIDEVFIDVAKYLNTYHMTAHELTMTMIREVLYTTGITATAGIGTNLYLAKVAMDIVAKHIPPDKDGVRVAELDEQKYRELLWCHTPLTDFWRVGAGYSKKLVSMGLYTMGDIARASLDIQYENMLYKCFGVNAELLIDHAWGWENTTIAEIQDYRPETHSISTSQVLKEPYSFEKARLIVKEMTELAVQDLVRNGVVTDHIVLTIGYDRESLSIAVPGRTTAENIYYVAGTGKIYNGKVTPDHYGRPHPSHSHGTASLKKYTCSCNKICRGMTGLFDKITDPELLIRRITIAMCNLIPETDIPADEPEQLDFFTDNTVLEKQRSEEKIIDEKEKNMLKAMICLKDRYGKNAVLRGINFMDGATTIERNEQIGGHKA